MPREPRGSLQCGESRPLVDKTTCIRASRLRGRAQGLQATSHDILVQDDASGRQQWTFTQSGTGYYMTINQGRAGCATYLSASACASTGLTFTSAPDTSSLQLWSVVSPAPPAPPTQILADGNYYIKSVARANCTAFLGGVTCGNSSNAVSTYAAPDALGTQVWTLTYLPLAAQPNTYNIVNSGRPSCFNFLSAIGCQANFVDLFVRVSPPGVASLAHSRLKPQHFPCGRAAGRRVWASAVADQCRDGRLHNHDAERQIGLRYSSQHRSLRHVRSTLLCDFQHWQRPADLEHKSSQSVVRCARSFLLESVQCLCSTALICAIKRMRAACLTHKELACVSHALELTRFLWTQVERSNWKLARLALPIYLYRTGELILS